MVAQKQQCFEIALGFCYVVTIENVTMYIKFLIITTKSIVTPQILTFYWIK